MRKYEAEKILDKYDSDNCECDAPCYVTRICVDTQPQDFNSERSVRQFIRAGRAMERRGIVTFSMTERNHGYKTFLKVAKSYKCATVVETKSRHHGDYKCWYILFPANGE